MGSHPKARERLLTRELRAERAMPLKQIAAVVGVSVNSVSLWTRDIDPDPERLAANTANAAMLRAVACSSAAREKRRAYQEAGRARAREGDARHQAGCMLYWAEGSKSRNSVTFSNSDLNMIVFFCRFLRECLRVAPDRLSVRLNAYTDNGLSVADIETHWLDALELPRACLRAHTLNHFPTSSSGTRRNKLPYGVCNLNLHSTRVVQHIYGAIQEYGGFEEPRWLN